MGKRSGEGGIQDLLSAYYVQCVVPGLSHMLFKFTPSLPGDSEGGIMLISNMKKQKLERVRASTAVTQRLCGRAAV